MNLSHREKENILKSLPFVELSYERNTHKKVYCSNIYVTIPKGQKYFAWFTNFKRNSVCFFFHLDRYKKRIQNIYVYNCCFDYTLTSGRGTLVYGTIFNIEKTRFFNIEDIFYFKGNSLVEKNQYTKLNTLKNVFKNFIFQKGYTKNDIIFGLPIIDKSRSNLEKNIQNLPYDIYCVQHRMLFRNSPFLNERVDFKRNITAIFLVKPQIEDDIYSLYCNDGDHLVYHSIACINDYKTSVLMNSLFRKIKENADLDKLEESDDEEEFENISEDKFVNLEKEIKISFTFCHKFKLWKPIEPTPDKSVTQIREILRVEK